ncbi:MAG: hypothetical protein J1F23_04630 [Oscillospiraceae bacterium]|nr:hypothetical protein [Oscillospiraceae bacterium]
MNSKKLITAILLLFLLAIPIQVFAAEATTVEIPFTVKNAPGTVVIEAVDNAPLPEQTVFEGVSSGKFEISFAGVGNYNYKIYQKSGTEQNVTYDSTVYTAHISVFVNEYSELYSVVSVYIDDSSQKTDDLAFENTSIELSEPSEPGEPHTPDSPNTPNTGDNSHLGLWIILMLISLLGSTEFLFLWKKAK